MSKRAKDQLRAAWDEMIGALQEVREVIGVPDRMPAPGNDRNLAEGYRYLMGFFHFAVERAFCEDPVRPHFRNALSIINRSTIDNPDAIYFYAPIEGRRAYTLRGEVGDTQHWRGGEAAPRGRKAPHYLIFEASWGELAGDSGDLSELRPGVKSQTGRIDSTAIEVDADGSFEILFAPERPANHTGNYVSTLKVEGRPHPLNPEQPAERYAMYVSGRQIFNDWNREDAIHFEMTPVDEAGTAAEAYSPDAAAEQLRRFGALVRNQMHFWNAFWTIPMGTYGAREGSMPGVAFPRNAFNQMNAASGATGGGMSTNLYAGGVAELGPDEALIIENRVKLPPQYIGFQIGNLWGESIEYGNSVGSRNGHQSRVDDDGVIRLVVAHEDPGVPNWLDTCGHSEGAMCWRWIRAVEHPQPATRVVPLSELKNG